jgi:carnosine N-methyltransferase
MDKARSTLKQFVRDWSVEGAKERELSYDPILNALNALYGSLSADEKFFPPTYLANCRAGIRVLVPGAGLGRILYEILRAGYTVQGNELEFCMLMASNLALNEYDPFPL